MGYPISSLVKGYQEKGYSDDHALVPHGLSVIIAAPAVFRFTAPACPERHLQAAEALGYDISNAKLADAGNIVADVLLKIMDDIGCPDGVASLGYSSDDIPEMVKGAIKQHRVTKLSPRPAMAEDLTEILEQSMKNF